MGPAAEGDVAPRAGRVRLLGGRPVTQGAVGGHSAAAAAVVVVVADDDDGSSAEATELKDGESRQRPLQKKDLSSSVFRVARKEGQGGERERGKGEKVADR